RAPAGVQLSTAVGRSESVGGRSPAPIMDVKRIFRSPWLWISLGVVGVLFVLQLLSSNSGYKNIDTSQMVGYINSGQVKSATFIEPDQELQATLANSEKVSSQVLIDQQYPLLQKLQKQEA